MAVHRNTVLCGRTAILFFKYGSYSLKALKTPRNDEISFFFFNANNFSTRKGNETVKIQKSACRLAARLESSRSNQASETKWRRYRISGPPEKWRRHRRVEARGEQVING